VEVDVRLALGELTITQAADYLARAVPMDKKTAETDAADYVAAPGLGMPMKSASCRLSECWRNGDYSWATSSTSANFTTMSGATATYRFRFSAGSCWAWTTT